MQHFAFQYNMLEEPTDDDGTIEDNEILESVRVGDGEGQWQLLIDEYVAYHEERTGVHIESEE